MKTLLDIGPESEVITNEAIPTLAEDIKSEILPSLIDDLKREIPLGTAASKDVGTEEDTVAAGDDPRITGALQKSGDTMAGPLTINSI